MVACQAAALVEEREVLVAAVGCQVVDHRDSQADACVVSSHEAAEIRDDAPEDTEVLALTMEGGLGADCSPEVGLGNVLKSARGTKVVVGVARSFSSIRASDDRTNSSSRRG